MSSLHKVIFFQGVTEYCKTQVHLIAHIFFVSFSFGGNCYDVKSNAILFLRIFSSPT